MLSSKANAALMRLREIEEKYKMKRIEQKWNRKKESDSSISSVSINFSEELSAQLKSSPRNVPKPKLDIKMPDMRFERHIENTKFLSQDKTSDETSPKPHEIIDLEIAVPLEDKSPRSLRKQESFISDVITILENSSIESTFNKSMTSSKSLSRSKISSRQFSTINNSKTSKYEEKVKADRKSEKEKQSNKSSDISRRELSDNSSIIKRSKLSEKSNDKISKTRSDLKSKEHSIEEKKIVKTSNRPTNFRRNSKISNHSGSSRDDSVIDESIGTLEDGSEIISELSPVEKSVANNTEDRSTNVLNDSKHSIAENGYANDTFEDISSSTTRSKSDRKESQSRRMINGKKETAKLTGSSIKQIEITPCKERRSYQEDTKSHRDKQVIESVAPETMRNMNNCDVAIFDKESSNYVKNFEKIDANVDNATVHSLKSLGSSSSYSKKQKRHWFEENVPTEKSSINDLMKTDERLSRRKNPPEIRTTSVSVGQQEDGREREKASDGTSAMTDVTESPVAHNAERIELAKFSSSREKYKEADEGENVPANNSKQQISSDSENATNVLRKSHRDTIGTMIKQDMGLKIMKEISESSSGHKTGSELRDAIITTRKIKSDRNSRENNIKKNKRIARVRDSKSIETRNSIESRKEDKALRHDRQQIYRLQRRTVELRLQREREDLQKYLHELKDSRLGLGTDSTRRSYFSPLDFPKIAEFAQSDTIDLESKSDNQHVVLQERVSAIRRWLKDQYILYRDYCTMAQAINAHYVPTTLEDAKKTIRELRKTGIKIR